MGVKLDLKPNMGSSPRMRGKLTDAGQEAADCGLIPAHAGKTAPMMEALPFEPAHPRACGENIE